MTRASNTSAATRAPVINSDLTRHYLTEACRFFALVAVGVTVRIYFRDVPNFAPVAALALFAGYAFRSWAVALAVPLSIMAISDWFIGGYDLWMMGLVYSMLALPVVWRPWLKRWLNVEGANGVMESVAPVTGLITCSLASAVLFFLVTNFGVWIRFDLYDRSLAGLVQCYVQAIPFFRYTLVGDLSFAVILFTGYALAANVGLAGAKKAKVTL